MLAVSVAGVPGATLSIPRAFAAGAIAYPDMQIDIPQSAISIYHPVGAPKELRFTHNTWDSGDGPLELQPQYNSSTGVGQVLQNLYSYDASGNRVLAQQLPIVGNFAYDPSHSHYHFPLDASALFAANPDGSVGAKVTASQKIGWCLGDDLQISNLPHSPATAGYSGAACSNPNNIEGISVGWADQYDWTDPGQTIDISAVPDGTYFLRAVVDPFGYLADKNRSNNATDVELKIAGDVVTVLGTTHPDSTPPTATLTAPVAGSLVSGTVSIAASVTDTTGVAGVQFLLDGSPLGPSVTTTPFAMSWDTTTVPNGPHSLSAQATNARGWTITAAPVSVTVGNSAPATSLVNDGQFRAVGTTSAAATVSTPRPGDLLAAFVSADGPTGGGQTAKVSGAGLTWALAGRTTAQLGTAEIWTATAPSQLSNAQITSTLGIGGYSQSLNVVAFGGAAGTGAVAQANAPSGAPTATVTTSKPGSWVFAVGDDWDSSLARTVGQNQVLLDQVFDSSGDTFWVQSQSATTAAPATRVSINDTAPSSDRWNLTAIEILANPAPPPTLPVLSNVTATVTSTMATITWTTDQPSTSQVSYGPTSGYGSSTGLDGTLVTSHSVTIANLTPSTTYHFQAASGDAAGTSTSGDQTFTTHAAPPPPLISNVTSTVTSTAATITWTTDQPSTSQVSYGPTSGYGSSTTVDPSQVTSHSVKLTGLTPSTTYHFQVTSGDAAGSSTSGDQTLTTIAVAPPGSLTIDGQASATGRGTTSASLSTGAAGDLVVAFVSSDGPSGGGQTAKLSGAGLTWKLAGRTNAQLGTSEIWTATAPAPLSAAAVTSVLSAGGYAQSLTVVAFAGASGPGAVVQANAAGGAPTAAVTTTRAGSWVFGVGDDWDNSIARTLGPSQVLLTQVFDPSGDTFWAQRQAATTPGAATLVTINDLAPTTDRWNLTILEILAK